MRALAEREAPAKPTGEEGSAWERRRKKQEKTKKGRSLLLKKTVKNIDDMKTLLIFSYENNTLYKTHTK
jgi:hypothetical protein